MPMFDRACNTCGKHLLDCLEPSEAPTVMCKCGGLTQRVWLGKTAGVIADTIPGGLYLKHGLCNADGSPKRYDSHSEIRAEAKRRGLENHVQHQPGKGTDKSKHTSRWV